MALVDLAYTTPIFNERSVIEALNEVLESDQLTDEDKLRFSQRKLDFLEDLGTDVEALVFFISDFKEEIDENFF